MKNIINDENNTRKFLDIKLEKDYGKIEFEIDEELESLSLNWANNSKFFLVYLFGPNHKLYGQLVTVANQGKRIISTNKKIVSPCCKTVESEELFKGKWILEYVAIGKNGPSSIDLWISKEDPTNVEEFNEVILDQKEDFISKEENLEKSWFAGDFHTHTIYSDGKMTREENIEIARRQKLNFFVPTDHNIFHYNWPKSGDIKVFPGTEVTSSLGHINLLFSEKNPFEEHSITEIEEGNSLIDIVEEAEKYSLVSINHPFMPPWDFLSKNFPLKKVKIMEIINDPTYKTSKVATKTALKAWNYLLNEGYKVVGIGGSDSHLRPDEKYDNSEYPSILGDPKTFLYSRTNTWENLKFALKQGEVTVSRGEIIDLDSNGLKRDNDNFMGEIILSAELKEGVFQNRKLYFNWVLDGEIIKKESGTRSKFNGDINLDYHWIRLDILDEEENLYGFTNPIYFNKYRKKPKMKTWGELMEKLEDED